MKRLAVIAVCAAWASTCAAQLVEVRMSDTSGMVTASVAGTPFIRAEMLQLVDNREGWRVVYSTGAGTDTVTLGDGTREFTQRVDDTITVDKSVEVAEGSLRVATRYTVEANVDANQNYYFVDIPAEAVEGALLTTVADGQTGTQILRPAQGTGTRLDALTECTFLTEAAEVHFALEAEHADWLFMDWTNTEHGSYRLRVERPVDPAGFTVRLAFTMTVKPSTPARLTDAVEIDYLGQVTPHGGAIRGRVLRILPRAHHVRSAAPGGGAMRSSAQGDSR